MDSTSRAGGFSSNRISLVEPDVERMKIVGHRVQSPADLDEMRVHLVEAFLERIETEHSVEVRHEHLVVVPKQVVPRQRSVIHRFIVPRSVR